MRTLAALLALLPALAVFAKPPEVSGYARMDELRQRMVARKDRLAEVESIPLEAPPPPTNTRSYRASAPNSFPSCRRVSSTSTCASRLTRRLKGSG